MRSPDVVINYFEQSGISSSGPWTKIRCSDYQQVIPSFLTYKHLEL